MRRGEKSGVGYAAGCDTRQQEEGRSAASRAQILGAAARLFREHGYAATPLRQIAAAAGIQAGSIYYHFASKDDILVEVLDTGIAGVFGSVKSKITALGAGASHRERIRAAVLGHLFGLLQHGDFSSASIRSYGQISAKLKQRHNGVREEYTRFWDELIVGAQRAGEIRDDIPAKTMRLYLLGALNWTVEWFNPRRGSLEELSNNLCALVFGGIVTGRLPHGDDSNEPPLRGRLRSNRRRVDKRPGVSGHNEGESK